MKVSGSAVLHAPRVKVWEALNDPSVLVQTIPGCQRLETIADGTYRMTLYAGVASVKGVYQGQVSLEDQRPPDSFVLKAAGAGAPGTISADVLVRLVDDGATTQLTYEADAVVGGMIGGVGQRMLNGVAKKTATEFFCSVDDHLLGNAPSQSPSPARVLSGGNGAVFEAPADLPVGAAGGAFVRGAVVGAGAALLGAVVGAWLTGRRRAPDC